MPPGVDPRIAEGLPTLRVFGRRKQVAHEKGLRYQNKHEKLVKMNNMTKVGGKGSINQPKTAIAAKVIMNPFK